MAIKISGSALVHIWDEFYNVWIRHGAYSNGIFVSSDEQTLISGFKASIQPAKARELILFPEGTKLTDANFAFSTSPIPLDDYQNNPGNYDIRLIYVDENGIANSYRLINVNAWNGYYYKYLVVQTRFLNEIPPEIQSKIRKK